MHDNIADGLYIPYDLSVIKARRTARTEPLGMPSISRRDFVNGVALSVASGLTPAAQIAAQPARYPPLLRGLRGQHAGSFEAAHAFARDRAAFSVANLPAEERYDLVVVGGGISGLAAAWFYRRARGARRASSSSTITTISAATPSATSSCSMAAWSSAMAAASRSIARIRGGATPARDCCASSASMCGGSRPRSSATSIRRSACRAACSSRAKPSAATMLATGDALIMPRNEVSRRLANAKPLTEFVAGFPISEASKAQLIGLYSGMRDPLAGRSVDEKLKLLKSTSYRDYLIKVWGCNEEVANCFQGRTLGFFGLGCDAVPAADVRDQGYPGFPRAQSARRRRIGRRRALHLSFPRRQRVAGAAAGARPRSRRRAGQHHGRYRAGAVRLRAARQSAMPMSASGSTRPASTCATPMARCSSAMSATASCIASPRGTRCWRAST